MDLILLNGGNYSMRFRICGYAHQNDEKRKIYYGTFDDYPEAYDYKEYLENEKSWDGLKETRPYMLNIEEIE